MNRSILAIATVLAVSACTEGGPISLGGESVDAAPERNAGGQPIAAQESATAAAAPNCYEVQVERPVDPRDERKIAGTAIGAVVGGAVGREVGDDNDLATAAGAAAGAFGGRVAQERYQQNRTETVTEVRCE